jgi:hypothetical protein
MAGQGIFAKQITDLFELSRRKAGIKMEAEGSVLINLGLLVEERLLNLAKIEFKIKILFTGLKSIKSVFLFYSG